MKNLADIADLHPDTGLSVQEMITAGIRRAAQQVYTPINRAAAKGDAPTTWQEWARTLFPGHVSRGFSEWQKKAWQWAWSIRRKEDAVRPIVAIAPRGGGKSTTAELISTSLGLRGVRLYVWYVRETQDQSDQSLSNVAELLESDQVERYYPEHAQRMLSKYGHSKGWNSSRLRTAGGLTVDAIGLDTAARGLKIGEVRPDLIVLDDIDGKHDGVDATRKKIQTITHTILPAGTAHTAVLGIQNLIIPHGVFSMMATGRADFLSRRVMLGPYRAVEGMETENVFDEESQRPRAVITKGRATWEGQSLADCQALMDQIGLRAFLQECQHEVHAIEGALWKQEDIDPYRVDAAPRLKRVVVGVDPSGGSAEIGILVYGLGYDGRLYCLEDVTQPGELGSLNWGKAAVDAYDRWQADAIVGERNYGGDMVESNIKVAAGDRYVPVINVYATRGKEVRAEPVASMYKDGLVSHVGHFQAFEQEMTTWTKTSKWSPNRLDAGVWAVHELALANEKEAPTVGVDMTGLTQASPWRL